MAVGEDMLSFVSTMLIPPFMLIVSLSSLAAAMAAATTAALGSRSVLVLASGLLWLWLALFVVVDEGIRLGPDTKPRADGVLDNFAPPAVVVASSPFLGALEPNNHPKRDREGRRWTMSAIVALLGLYVLRLGTTNTNKEMGSLGVIIGVNRIFAG